jgi:hypothetical protein
MSSEPPRPFPTYSHAWDIVDDGQRLDVLAAACDLNVAFTSPALRGIADREIP